MNTEPSWCGCVLMYFRFHVANSCKIKEKKIKALKLKYILMSYCIYYKYNYVLYYYNKLRISGFNRIIKVN